MDLAPYGEDAERAILGAVLADPEAYPRAADVLSPEDFHLEAHRRIWGAMHSLHDAGITIDRVTVATHLGDKGQLDSVGGLSRLLSLDSAVGFAGSDQYARIVKEFSVRRRAIAACQKLQNELQLGGNSAEVLERAERLIRGLGSEAEQQKRRLKKVSDIIAEYGGLDSFFDPSANAGIPVRWPALNDMLAGLHEEELILLAARPSVGKTAAGLDIAEWSATHGNGTLVFSFEMPAKQLLTRMACSRAHVDSNKHRHGALNSDERRRLSMAMAELDEFPIWFDDTASCTVPALHATIRRHMAEHQVGLVVIDYLQLMESTSRAENRNQEVSTISRGLKLAAKEFAVPFVVLSQLTRGPEHEKRRPQLTDLRESGSLEQDADVVAFIHRKDQTFGDVQACEFIVAKQRNGPIGYVPMNFIRQYTRFEESIEAEEAA